MTMRRLTAALIFLLCLPTITFTLPVSSAQSKTEELLSSIAPEKWYLGSDVKDAIRSLLAAWQDESAATAKAAAAEAVKTCTADLNAVRASVRATLDERDGWRLATVAGVSCAGVLALILAAVIAVPHIFP